MKLVVYVWSMYVCHYIRCHRAQPAITEKTELSKEFQIQMQNLQKYFRFLLVFGDSTDWLHYARLSLGFVLRDLCHSALFIRILFDYMLLTFRCHNSVIHFNEHFPFDACWRLRRRRCCCGWLARRNDFIYVERWNDEKWNECCSVVTMEKNEAVRYNHWPINEFHFVINQWHKELASLPDQRPQFSSANFSLQNTVCLWQTAQKW